MSSNNGSVMSQNVSDTETLSTEQRQAVSALAAGATKDMAAVAANRTRRTIDRWIAEEPAFTAALQSATDTAVKDASRRLSGLLDTAITAVANDLAAGNLDTLRALDSITKNTVKLREVANLLERLERLEEIYNDKNK